MKKGAAAGVILLLTAGAALACAHDGRSDRIETVIKENMEISGIEQSALDLNADGTVDRADHIRAKAAALLHHTPAQEMHSITEVLPVGRTAYHDNTQTLWCAHAGSGVSFGFQGACCDLALTADSAYTAGENGAVRYAVYVNDVLTAEGMLTEPEQTVSVDYAPGADGYAWVRLVKLSESACSAMGVRDIALLPSDADGCSLIPAERKQHLIEFIGDSITCGYGVDGENGRDSFLTSNENAAKTYGYLTAQKLCADYSLVCFSGYGILSGSTGTGEINTYCLLPPYYDRVGFSTALIERACRIQDEVWDFEAQPDAVVINLGTNDATYTGTDPERQQAFISAYTDFLHTVRAKNPDAVIICTLGIMGQTLCNAVEQAVRDYQEVTGDSRVYTMRFDPQLESDGFGVNWHPSAVTHEKAAEKLTAFIRETCGWE